MFPLGETSGEFGNQCSFEMLCPTIFFNQMVGGFDVCARAPSCWKHPSLLLEKRLCRS